MTLQELLQSTYRRIQQNPSPSSPIVTEVTNAINEAQQELAADPFLTSLRRGATSFASVASTPEYGLPPVVQRIVSVRETTSDRRLRPESRDWYRWRVPDASASSGTPDRYVPLGPQVASRPSDASSIYAVSTSASDTQYLYYEVVITGGFTFTGTVQLTGTTGITLSSSLTNIVEIVDWYLDSPAVGTVTLREDSGAGTTLGTIAAGTSRTVYEGIALFPTPSDARTYYVEFDRRITDLVSPKDAPGWLPDAFHRLLSIGARRRWWEDHDDADRYERAAAEWTLTLSQLHASITNPPDFVMVPGMRSTGRSDLGGMYPAGTIWE